MKTMRLVVVLTVIVLSAPTCKKQSPAPLMPPSIVREPAATAFTLSSTAFENDQPIPKQYTGEGADLSPPLAWHKAPPAAVSFALICDDPDAPGPQPWVHWVIYNIPPDQTALAEGISADAHTPGLNSWGKTGYGGPMPPPGSGVHHYHFRLYALETILDFTSPPTKDQLLAAINDHIIAETHLTGTYQR